MKKILLLGALACSSLFISAFAASSSESPVAVQPNKDSYAEIRFDTLKIDLGTFSESEPVRKCTFNFTNVGTAPLIIQQAFASCGCTVPTFTKTPIKPGEKGQVDVTYNGAGKFPGKFSKTVTVRSNGRNEVVRLIIEGNMTEAKAKK